MKKIILVLCTCLLLTGCRETSESSGDMFITIETDWTYKVVYNRNTKVMYAVSDGTSNQGVFTLLVNADGTPMLYEESEAEE